jgi:hypothetical protein
MNASFLITIALPEDLLDTSECIPDQLPCILGGDRKGDGYTVGVLGLIPKPAGHQKDRQDPCKRL